MAEEAPAKRPKKESQLASPPPAPSQQLPEPVEQLTSSSPVVPSRQLYYIQYENNNSKRWDGKVIQLEGEWLESLYQREELLPGKKVVLPWQGKSGSPIQHWNGVVVAPPTPSTAPATASASTSTTSPQKGTRLVLCSVYQYVELVLYLYLVVVATT